MSSSTPTTKRSLTFGLHAPLVLKTTAFGQRPPRLSRTLPVGVHRRDYLLPAIRACAPEAVTENEDSSAPQEEAGALVHVPQGPRTDWAFLASLVLTGMLVSVAIAAAAASRRPIAASVAGAVALAQILVDRASRRHLADGAALQVLMSAQMRAAHKASIASGRDTAVMGSRIDSLQSALQSASLAADTRAETRLSPMFDLLQRLNDRISSIQNDSSQFARQVAFEESSRRAVLVRAERAEASNDALRERADNLERTLDEMRARMNRVRTDADTTVRRELSVRAQLTAAERRLERIGMLEEELMTERTRTEAITTELDDRIQASLVFERESADTKRRLRAAEAEIAALKRKLVESETPFRSARTILERAGAWPKEPESEQFEPDLTERQQALLARRDPRSKQASPARGYVDYDISDDVTAAPDAARWPSDPLLRDRREQDEGLGIPDDGGFGGISKPESGQPRPGLLSPSAKNGTTRARNGAPSETSSLPGAGETSTGSSPFSFSRQEFDNGSVSGNGVNGSKPSGTMSQSAALGPGTNAKRASATNETTRDGKMSAVLVAEPENQELPTPAATAPSSSSAMADPLLQRPQSANGKDVEGPGKKVSTGVTTNEPANMNNSGRKTAGAIPQMFPSAKPPIKTAPQNGSDTTAKVGDQLKVAGSGAETKTWRTDSGESTTGTNKPAPQATSKAPGSVQAVSTPPPATAARDNASGIDAGAVNTAATTPTTTAPTASTPTATTPAATTPTASATLSAPVPAPTSNVSTTAAPPPATAPAPTTPAPATPASASPAASLPNSTSSVLNGSEATNVAGGTVTPAPERRETPKVEPNAKDERASATPSTPRAAEAQSTEPDDEDDSAAPAYSIAIDRKGGAGPDKTVAEALELVSEARRQPKNSAESDRLYGEAVRMLKQAAEETHDAAHVVAEYGAVLLAWAKANLSAPASRGRLEEAVRALAVALKEEPNDEVSIFNRGLCLCMLAAAHASSNSRILYHEACRMFDTLLQVNPKSRVGAFNCGLSHLSLARLAEYGNDDSAEDILKLYCEAKVRFDLALSLLPGDAKATKYSSECQAAIDKLNEALG